MKKTQNRFKINLINTSALSSAFFFDIKKNIQLNSSQKLNKKLPSYNRAKKLLQLDTFVPWI